MGCGSIRNGALRCAILLGYAVLLSLTVGGVCAAEPTDDWLDDWPRTVFDEQRNDSERRPIYQKLPPGAIKQPVSTTAHAVGSMIGTHGVIQRQSFETPVGNPPAVFTAPLSQLALPVGPPEPWWVEGEYLLWWIKGMKNTPPLVTTSSNQTDGGVLGTSTTGVLFPTAPLFESPGSGGRIRFGHWWNQEHTAGIDGDLWGFSGPHQRFAVSSNGSTLLARPFFDTGPTSPGQNAEVVATTIFPARSGGVQVAAESDLYAAGIGWRWQLAVLRPSGARPCLGGGGRFRFLPRGDIRLDFTCGYRYARLDEQLSIFEQVTVNAGTSSGDRYDVQDHFRTRNDFNGVEFGLHYAHQHCRWSVDLRPRLAFGNVRQRVQIDGSTLYTPSTGATVNEVGGLLALAGTNIGTTTRDQFSFLPQIDARVGYRFTDRLALTVGYSFLYWLRVARPGEQIDFNVNSTYFPDSNPSGPATPPSGPADPTPLEADAAFWAQGLNLGFEYRF